MCLHMDFFGVISFLICGYLSPNLGECSGSMYLNMFSVLPSVFSRTRVLILCYRPTGPLGFTSFFPAGLCSLSFRLEFWWSSLKFTGSVLCHLHWMSLKNFYCIIQFCESHLLLFCNFFFCWLGFTGFLFVSGEFVIYGESTL